MTPEEAFAEAFEFFAEAVKRSLEVLDDRMDHIEAELSRQNPLYLPWRLPDELRAEIEQALADAEGLS